MTSRGYRQLVQVAAFVMFREGLVDDWMDFLFYFVGGAGGGAVRLAD